MSNECQQLDKLVQQAQTHVKVDRDAAEKQLQALKLDQATTTILLEYITNEQNFDHDRRFMVATILKNIIAKAFGQEAYTNYDEATAQRKEAEALTGSEDDSASFVDPQGMALLQQNLVALLMACPSPKIAKMFSEMISLMGKRYVYKEWPSLLPELASHILSQSLRSTQLSLICIKKLCKKYRFMFRSDALYTEMNYVIETLSNQLLQKLCETSGQLQQVAQGALQVSKEDLMTLIDIENSILNIYESILSQDECPDFYADNLDQISQVGSFLLEIEFPQLQTTEEKTVQMKAKAKVVRLVHLYQFKFSEDFEKYSQHFFQKVWDLVGQNKLTANRECHKLVFATIRYFGECCILPQFQKFLKENLSLLFNVLVLPNISITEEDIDEYEDDPQAYIKNDLEESDQETRRRQCMKFVQALSKRFQNEMGVLIGQLFTQLQAEYEQNKSQQWLKKTTLLNLLITASISCYTYQHGATELLIENQMLFDYLEKLVIPELQVPQGADIDTLPQLKATCIKFVYMFRNQIPDQHVPVFVGLFSDYLKSAQIVNQSYAAACIEKLLIRKRLDGTDLPVMTQQSVDQVMLSKLLQNLCELLNDNKDLYAVRALLRVIQLSQQNLVPFAGTLGQVFGSFIGEVAKDESGSSPNYTYTLFEATALTLQYIRGDKVAFQAVEDQVTPALNYIIEQNISDLSGYAFQLYATFVASSSELKPNYQLLCQSIVENTSNWGKEMKYLIPALGIFLTTIIKKHPEYFKQYIAKLQEIVNQLMSPQVRMEQVALSMSYSLFEEIGITFDDGSFLHQLLYGIFTALHFYRNNTKRKVIPMNIMKNIHSFFATFMVCHGTDALLTATNKIQQDILFMILKSESSSLKSVLDPARDKRYTIVAYSRLLAENCSAMPLETVQHLACGLIELTATKQLTGFARASVLRGVGATEEMLMDGAIDQTFAFSHKDFIQLSNAKIDHTDKLKDQVPREDQFMMTCLQQTCTKLNQSVNSLILEQKHAELLQKLCNDTGIALQ